MRGSDAGVGVSGLWLLARVQGVYSLGVVALMVRPNVRTVPPSAGYLKRHQVTKCPGSWLGSSFVGVPSLRRRSVGTPPSAIHGEGRLSRHPCRSAHSTPPAFSLHPSHVLWCLDCRVQEQCWLELTLLAFLVRTSVVRTPLCRSALARDLPGTGSKTCACGVSGETELPGFATAAR
jgi:hypothetical protein